MGRSPGKNNQNTATFTIDDEPTDSKAQQVITPGRDKSAKTGALHIEDGQVTWEIDVNNTYNVRANLKNTEITDFLPDGFEYVDGSFEIVPLDGGTVSKEDFANGGEPEKGTGQDMDAGGVTRDTVKWVFPNEDDYHHYKITFKTTIPSEYLEMTAHSQDWSATNHGTVYWVEHNHTEHVDATVGVEVPPEINKTVDYNDTTNRATWTARAKTKPIEGQHPRLLTRRRWLILRIPRLQR